MVFKVCAGICCIFMGIRCCDFQAACQGNEKKYCVMCGHDFDFENACIDSDLIGSCTGTQLYDGQLAIASPDGVVWEFVIVYENFPHETEIPVHHCTLHTRINCSRTLIKALKPYWQWVLQKKPPRGIMRDVWLNYLRSMALRTDPYIDTRILNDSTTVTAIGDLHGDIDSLMFHLRRFKALGIINDEGVISPDHRVIFLGDYTDRGMYGSNVWWVLMHLFNINPDRVCLLRGNHETMLFAQLCFLREWASKFTYGLQEHEQKSSLKNLYKSLPCASLIGFKCSVENSLPQIFKFLLLCHGGIDRMVPLTNAIRSIIDQCKRSATTQSKFYIMHPDIAKSGLLWSDFHAQASESEPSLAKLSERGYGYLTYNSAAAREFVAEIAENSSEFSYSLCGVVDGHEHVSGGINRLRAIVDFNGGSWQCLDSMTSYTINRGDVFTCASSPDGLAGFNCKEDACAMIRCGQDGNLQLTPFIQARSLVTIGALTVS